MLRCVLRDVNDRLIVMPRILSLKVNVDEGIPADSLEAVFPMTQTAELCGITLYRDKELLFVGIVDEEERERQADGEYLHIHARSQAAHLLDNEAMPCAFDHPGMRMIYDRYVRPYGITMDDADDAVYFGEQVVLKGSSCYKALKTFCVACYSAVPRISSTGVLYPKGMKKNTITVFGGNGVPYISLREVKKRCEEISTVYVKATSAGSYTLPIRNMDAIGRGIRRERYLNAALTESPMRCADEMILNGRAKNYAVHLRCPSCLLGCEGDRAMLRDTSIGKDEELYVSAVHYRMTKDGEYSDVVLKRRKADVDQ